MQNILTESEYNEKLRVLEKKAIDIRDEQIESQIKNEIETNLKKLNELLISGILTQNEFEEKRDKLYIDCKSRLQNKHDKVGIESNKPESKQLLSEIGNVTREISHIVVEKSKIKTLLGKREELKIKFSDGKVGMVFFSYRNNKYFVKGGRINIYYSSEDKAVEGLHHFLTSGTIFK
jgi:hypothetical protein